MTVRARIIEIAERRGRVRGVFSQIGDLLNASGAFAGATSYGETGPIGIAAHAVAGCVVSAAGGGKCGPAALSAAFSQAALPLKQGLDPLGGTIVSALIGGTASALGGGKFANGAITAAEGYLFNYCMHDGKCFTATSERALLDKKDYAGYYKLACEGDDAYACQAGDIAAGKSLPAVMTTARLIDYASENGVLLTQDKLNDIRLKLTVGYANYLGDSPDKAKVPSAMSIAEIHWNVFDTYNIPPRAFGGTPFGTWTPGGTWYTKQYPAFIGGGTGWCPKCAP
jgi:hypothetical protein